MQTLFLNHVVNPWLACLLVALAEKSNAVRPVPLLYQVGPKHIALYLLPPKDERVAAADSPAVQSQGAHPAAKKTTAASTAAARKRAKVAPTTARAAGPASPNLAHVPALLRLSSGLGGQQLQQL